MSLSSRLNSGLLDNLGRLFGVTEFLFTGGDSGRCVLLL